MPAKKKYLSGPLKRFSKVTAAILGGYVVTMFLHITLAKVVPNDTPVIMSAAYTSFLVWTGFMTLAFYIRKAWHVWGLYTLLSGVFFAIYYMM